MFCQSFCVFFFKQKTAYGMRISDWSSDVCSSDLPQHERASQLFSGRYGGLMGVELDPRIDVFEVLNRLKVVILATHLGDNRTLVLPAAHTIYYEMGPERRALMGIPDGFLRISVGIEDENDLTGDFAQALDAEDRKSTRLNSSH